MYFQFSFCSCGILTPCVFFGFIFLFFFFHVTMSIESARAFAQPF